MFLAFTGLPIEITLGMTMTEIPCHPLPNASELPFLIREITQLILAILADIPWYVNGLIATSEILVSRMLRACGRW